MAVLAMKFGGTSVADLDRIRYVARHVKREVKAGHQCAVVVSAMAGETNRLVDLVKQAHPRFDEKEYDAVVSSGEQVTSGLLALVLQSMGIPARSYQGWQIPMKTNDQHARARITDIDGEALLATIKNGEVAVIAGFVTWNVRASRLGDTPSETRTK